MAPQDLQQAVQNADATQGRWIRSSLPMEDAAGRLFGIGVDGNTNGMTARVDPRVHALALAPVERPETQIAGCCDAGESSAVTERVENGLRRICEHIDTVARTDKATDADRDCEFALADSPGDELARAGLATKTLHGGDG
jgi:hypothetical protein